MKYFLSVLLFFLLGQISFGQKAKGSASIEGFILDTTNKKPIEFATIALKIADTKETVDGNVSDEKGEFKLENLAEGKYLIEADFLGYETKTLKLTVKDGATVKLGRIYLVPEVRLLGEVTIEGQNEMVEEKVDRLVYNAEKDVSSKGGDASDVMRNVPLLTVDLDGNVSLRGSSNVKVLINNKPSSIMSSSVADALKQIPADMIKSIEVITSPSARYESEGSVGIINIITKKNTLQGLTLGVDASVGNRGSSFGLNGNFRQGNMGFSLRGFGRGEYNVKGAFENIQSTFSSLGNKTVDQSASTTSQSLRGNYNFGWDWDITKKANITAGIRLGTRNRYDNQDRLITLTTLPGNTIPLFNGRNVDTKDLSTNYDISTTYTYNSAPQKELSILGLYSRDNRKNNFEADLFSNIDFAAISSREKNDNPSNNIESTLEVNYQTPGGTRSLVEFGGKGIFRQAKSDYQYLISEGGSSSFQLDPLRNSNQLNYNQTVGAGYLSYTYTTRSKFSLKAGTRLEYTDITADFSKTGSGEITKIPSYWSWIPSVNLSQPISKKITLKGGYNRRIQRPGIQFLNPNVNSSNPSNISVGNPYLSPEYTDNFELSTSFNKKGLFLTTALYYRHTGNSINSFKDTFSIKNPNLSESGYVPALKTTYENIGTENTIGANVFGNFSMIKNLSINGGFDLYNVTLSNNNPNPDYTSSNSGWVFGGRAFGNYKFNNGWGIQGGGGARGRQVSLQGYSGSFSFYFLGLRKDFNEGKGNISLSAQNFLNNPFIRSSKSESPLFSQSSTNSFYNSGIRIGINYRIGKMSFEDRKKKKSINNDDLKSEGGGGDTGGDTGNGTGQQNVSTGNQARGNAAANGTSGGAIPNQQSQSANGGQSTNPDQTSGVQGPGGNLNPTSLHDSLQLNPEQITKFDAVQEKYSTQMRTMMQEGRANGLTREDLKPKMDVLRADQEAELKTILSSDQLIKYKQIQANRAQQQSQQWQNRSGEKQ
ncbi:MAG: TonB-dependent receptor [Saprospiraceae bacterium]